MTNGQLLRRARLYFDVHGYVPYDIASQLMQRGYIVADLERKWAGDRD